MPDGSSPTVPRFDVDAEGVCLSAALLDRDAALELVELLDAGDYWSDANRQVHSAIRDLCTRGEVVDVVTVAAELRARNALSRVGGTPYLGTLLDQPAAASIEPYAKIVRGWARVRQAQVTFRQLTAEASSSEIPDVAAWLDSCERRAYEATAAAHEQRASVKTYGDTGAVIRAGWAEQEARADRTWGTATGIHRLDEHTLGMQPGQLWVLGARPGQGKTSIAQQIGEYIAERGGGRDSVVMSSQEMESRELLVRGSSRTSGVRQKAILQRKMDRASWDAYLEAEKRMAAWPFAIDDEKRITPFKLRAKIRRNQAKLRERFPGATLRLVIVDYVQLMQPNEHRRNSTRAAEIGEITAELKRMAGEFACTILLLSQLTRPEKNKPVAVPTLFDFRDSGSIEADGDVLIALHRPDQYLKAGENPTGTCEVHVLKGRACGECSFELGFDGPLTRFDNLDVNRDRLWRGRDDD